MAGVDEITPGCYRHYKGARYEVLGVAAHESTKERFVVYRSLVGGALWIRPLDQFLHWVIVPSQGTTVRRFERIADRCEPSTPN